MLSYVYGTEKPTLAQEARANTVAFEERKNRRKSEWIEALIKKARAKILLKASLGESSTSFYLEEEIFSLKPIVAVVDGKEERYELTFEDKDYLMTEVVKHYSDEESYPYLRCHSEVSVTNAIFFGWEE